VALFAASVDEPETNGKFARDIHLDYPILSDPSREAARAYGVVRDEKGLATRWTFYVGIDGKILYVDRQVSPSAHGGAVAAKLAELGVKRRTPVRRQVRPHM
jgi:thioredoxin-dependent peroxiredoxin